MHGGNEPLTVFFRDSQGEIEGKRELFPILFSTHISGRHQPAHLWRQSTNPELVFEFEFLFSLVETLEEVLIGHLDLVRPRPDFPGTGAP